MPRPKPRTEAEEPEAEEPEAEDEVLPRIERAPRLRMGL